MPADETCRTCVHWAATDDDLGQCRRHAPRPRTSDHDVAWPVTDSDDWCGEWEPPTCDCDDDEVCDVCEPDDIDSAFAELIGQLNDDTPRRRRWWGTRRHGKPGE